MLALASFLAIVLLIALIRSCKSFLKEEDVCSDGLFVVEVEVCEKEVGC